MSALGVLGELVEIAQLLLRRVGARTLGIGTTKGSTCAILDRDGNLLLVRTRYGVGWGLVGGYGHADERPEATMIREAREEVGLDLTGRLRRAVVQCHPSRHTTTVFTARVDDVRPALRLSRPLELRDIAWFSALELPKLNSFTQHLIAPSRPAVQIVDGRFVPTAADDE